MAEANLYIIVLAVIFTLVAWLIRIYTRRDAVPEKVMAVQQPPEDLRSLTQLAESQKQKEPYEDLDSSIVSSPPETKRTTRKRPRLPKDHGPVQPHGSMQVKGIAIERDREVK